VVGFGQEKNSSNLYIYIYIYMRERAVISMGTMGSTITSNFSITINDHHLSV